MLFKRLVGNGVLSVANETTLGRTVRVYAFCTTETSVSSFPAGSVTVAYLNVQNTSATVDFAGLAAYPRAEFRLTSPNLGAPTILLNGNVLEPSESGNLPLLLPNIVTTDDPLVLDPLSYGFIVFPEANAPACLSI